MPTDKTQTPHDPQAHAKLDAPESAKGEQNPKAAKESSPASQTPRDPQAHAKLDSSEGAKGPQKVDFQTTPDQKKAEAKRRAAHDDGNEPTPKQERVQEEKKDDVPQNPMVQALLIEREGLAAQGKSERVALVDEQLVYHGYDPRKQAAEKRAAASESKTEVQPKQRQTPEQRNRTA
jgi:hypothetical protein